MLDRIGLSAVNHVLRGNAWALERLQPFAGQTARFECGPFGQSVSVTERGELMPAAAGAVPAVTLNATPGVLMRLLARDERARTEVSVSGDTAFATALEYVWRNARWDVEEDLSRAIGDMAAHRVVSGARAVEQWTIQSSRNVAQAAVDYWTEEHPLVAGRTALEQFSREVDLLRDDVARLEKRLEALAARKSGTPQ